jgi:hypothetical protein
MKFPTNIILIFACLESFQINFYNIKILQRLMINLRQYYYSKKNLNRRFPTNRRGLLPFFLLVETRKLLIIRKNFIFLLPRNIKTCLLIFGQQTKHQK